MLIRRKEKPVLRTRDSRYSKAAQSKRKETRGATDSRTDQGSNTKWGRVVLLSVLFVASIGGLAQLPWQHIYAKTLHATNRPLASIKIEGEFRYVSKSLLQKAISSKLDGNFVDIDLRQIKFAIEENPWIKSVKIERIWPDSLKLNIEEHTPIARWNGDGFLNREGQLVTVNDNKALSNLPLLSGEKEISQELAKNYVSFTHLLKGTGLNIGELDLDKTLSWSIRLKDSFVLHLGREDIESKLENFGFIYKEYLEKNKSDIAAIDMRYQDGLAVEWKRSPEALALHSSQTKN